MFTVLKLESPMIHTKFHDHWTSGTEDFNHIWSYGPNHLYKLSCPLPMNAPRDIWNLLNKRI